MFKCCKQDSTVASDALAEPQEVFKMGNGTEASEEDAAAEASYNCCGLGLSPPSLNMSDIVSKFRRGD